MEARTLTLLIPSTYTVHEALKGAPPEDVATILGYGCDLFTRGTLIASKAGALAIAELEAEHRSALKIAGHEFAEREALVRRELDAARAALDALSAETRELVGRAVLAATSSAAARTDGLSSELARTRDELAAFQRGHVAAVLEAAASARGEVAAELRGRLAALEAELTSARACNVLSLESAVSGLATRFDRIFSPQTPSAVKGRLGEASLAALLLSLFPDAELADCASVPGSGDATLTIVRDGRPVRIMIESKNVTRVRADDLVKFSRDCANRAAAADVDAALFASLDADSIPRKGAIAFEVVEGLPALFLAAVAAKPEALRLGVESLVFAALHRPRDCAPPPEDWADVREAVSIAFSVLSRQAERARALRASAAAVLEALSEFEGESTIAVAAIQGLWAARPSLRRPITSRAAAAPPPAHTGPRLEPADPHAADPHAADPHAAAALRVRAFLDDRQRDPTRDEVVKDCKVPEATLRKCGGARALISRAKRAIL